MSFRALLATTAFFLASAPLAAQAEGPPRKVSGLSEFSSEDSAETPAAPAPVPATPALKAKSLLDHARSLLPLSRDSARTIFKGDIERYLKRIRPEAARLGLRLEYIHLVPIFNPNLSPTIGRNGTSDFMITFKGTMASQSRPHHIALVATEPESRSTYFVDPLCVASAEPIALERTDFRQTLDRSVLIRQDILDLCYVPHVISPVESLGGESFVPTETRYLLAYKSADHAPITTYLPIDMALGERHEDWSRIQEIRKAFSTDYLGSDYDFMGGHCAFVAYALRNEILLHRHLLRSLRNVRFIHMVDTEAGFKAIPEEFRGSIDQLPRFKYHTALYIETTGEAAILDPAVSENPLSLSHWRRRFSGNASTLKLIASDQPYVGRSSYHILMSELKVGWLIYEAAGLLSQSLLSTSTLADVQTTAMSAPAWMGLKVLEEWGRLPDSLFRERATFLKLLSDGYNPNYLKIFRDIYFDWDHHWKSVSEYYRTFKEQTLDENNLAHRSLVTEIFGLPYGKYLEIAEAYQAMRSEKTNPEDIRAAREALRISLPTYVIFETPGEDGIKPLHRFNSRNYKRADDR